jgi:hypothetical protein
MGDDVIMVAYTLRNLRTSVVPDCYAGLFVDWDIGPLYGNLGGIDTVRGLAYEYDPSGADPNFCGIVALHGMSGAAVTDGYPAMGYLASLHQGGGQTASIRYQVSATGDVKLVVYDLLGREVAVLVDEKQAAGTYTVQFAPGDAGLASGVYAYRRTSGSNTAARNMVLVK